MVLPPRCPRYAEKTRQAGPQFRARRKTSLSCFASTVGTMPARLGFLPGRPLKFCSAAENLLAVRVIRSLTSHSGIEDARNKCRSDELFVPALSDANNESADLSPRNWGHFELSSLCQRGIAWRS